jgi:hypothetical protein
LSTILLYHVYPVNHWREVTRFLFQKLPFKRIVVHVSVPADKEDIKGEVESYFKAYPVDEILYSPNTGKGEVDAMNRFVTTQNLAAYDIFTYMHCKGVTKPDNRHVWEWTRLMRYFIIEKMDRCKRAFKKGFVTFGINKSIPGKEDEGFRGSNFFYEGNFVSVNLKKVNLAKAIEHIEYTYYGLEGFWGKLCSYKEGYSAFNSGVNHYLLTVPERHYTTVFGKLKYNMIKRYYQIKSKVNNAKAS